MIVETLKLASSALWVNKLRTFLTLLGLVIGIASVIGIISLLEGMTTRINQLFEEQGTTTIFVTRFGIITSEEEFLRAIKRKKLSLDDAKAIAKSCPLAQEVGIEVSDNLLVKSGNESLFNVMVFGNTANSVLMRDLEVVEGRFISESDDEHRQNVAVIGQELKNKFFPMGNALGKEISIQGTRFTVIGVGEEKGSVFGENMDRYCRIPANTMLKMTGRRQDIDITVKVASESQLDAAMDEIRTVLRARRGVKYHDPDDFAMLTSEMMMNFFSSFSSNARIIAFSIPAISIIVAGIVVMNIMMVSVTERTREIGIRKAIGARQNNILTQFLLEATLMSLLGGIIGTALGLWLSYFVAGKADILFVISPLAVGFGLIIPIAIGLF
ncbi:MAG: ABC transporter permease, partial [Candidatus Zixiibacteriota bacterium]